MYTPYKRSTFRMNLQIKDDYIIKLLPTNKRWLHKKIGY